MASPLDTTFSFLSPDHICQIKRDFANLGSGDFTLTLDNDTGIARLAIDHYEKRNSLSGSMIARFDQVLNQLEQWKEVSDAVFS